MRTGVLEAVALLALGSCLHICKAQNTTTQTLFQYLTALEQNRTFFYEPANPGYYASINNNTIIEFNGTFYEDFNGTFYALQRQANGSLVIPANATAIVESGNADGQSLFASWINPEIEYVLRSRNTSQPRCRHTTAFDTRSASQLLLRSWSLCNSL